MKTLEFHADEDLGRCDVRICADVRYYTFKMYILT